MGLDSKGLGRLRKVTDPRSVWTSEPYDFTPWLAENIDILADTLKMSLTVVGREVGVGDFSCDILAQDAQDRTVVIENQLERTDHTHLGQCLVYASGLNASAVVWVATKFREEFRSALDWLNERTDSDLGFFGVEVSIVQIGTGPPAPVFDVVSRPNDWQRAVKAAGNAAEARTQSPLNVARQDYFAEILAAVNRERPAISIPTPTKGNWIGFDSGPFGYWCLTVTSDSRLRVEAYIDTQIGEVNKALLDEFAAGAPMWETKVGQELSWERLDDKRASRIAAYKGVDLENPDDRDEALRWGVRTFVAMFDMFNEPLRLAAKRRKGESDPAQLSAE